MNSKKVASLMEEDLDSGDLPKEWKVVTILDACEVNPPKPSKEFLPADAPVTFVPMPAVDADMGAITNPQIKPYLEVRNGFTSFRDGDVIMAKITPCMENGKAAIVHGMKNGIGFGSTEFHVMRSRGKILPEYLYYYIRQESFRNEAESHFTGSVGQKRVPADFIKQSVIPLPPLSEQQHIVARVEALLTHVNAALDRLSRVPLIMKKFRQAVLAAACSGRLTEGWREEHPDVEPAKNLLKQIRHESINVTKPKKFTETGENCVASSFFEIPDTWIWVSIEEILKNTQHLSYGILKPGDPDPNGVPMVRVLDIGNWGLNKTEIVRVSPSLAAQYERTKLEEGDILLAVMATVGRAIVVPPSLKGANVNRALAVIKLHSLIDPHYACSVIRSPYFQDVFSSEKIGSAQARINISDLRKFSFPLPPLAEQHEIVRRVGLLFERADAFDREVAAAGRRCERLTQAVLGKAFAGKL